MKISYPRRRSEKLGRALLVRAQPPLVAQIDTWIARNGESMSRPEALRRLATIGLSASEKAVRSGDRVAFARKSP
jgi:hypothetical protein